MEWLLKIVDGPMKGAEIALVSGTRVTLGKGDGCDIIVADASIADEALSLDVAESGVTLVRGDGTGVAMRPFEIQTLGTTALAVGPAEGAWEELREAANEAKGEGEGEGVGVGVGVGVGGREAGRARSTSAPQSDDAAAADGADSAAASSRPPYRRAVLAGCCTVVLLLAAAVAIWHFWPQIAARCPRAEQIRVTCANFIRRACVTRATAPAAPKLALADIAAAHHLNLNLKPQPLLSGNLKRRTERHAIRALALAADRNCRFDLSDDESFRSAAEALVFTVTEEAVRVVSATNRQIAITGYAPNAVAMRMLEKAMRADIPWVAGIDASRVRVGGPVPPELRNSRFATAGRLVVADPDGEAAECAQAAATSPKDASAAKLVDGAVLPKNFLPVAGVLTKPYPCVVLKDGHRLVEGAKILNLEILAIEADRLLLGVNGIKVSWEP